jgi:hypothetical protein
MGQSGVEVVDLARPEEPRRVAVVETFPAYGAVVDDGLVYVAGGPHGMLVAHWRQTLPRFESPARFSDSNFHLFVKGEMGQIIGLQRSHDLERWEDWLSVIGTGDTQEIVDDGAASEPMRFYRAMAPSGAIDDLIQGPKP